MCQEANTEGNIDQNPVPGARAPAGRDAVRISLVHDISSGVRSVEKGTVGKEEGVNCAHFSSPFIPCSYH
jgi:hypothetical protein